MKILSYRMTYDSGFAPNPFGGILTLATCTPNHKRARLEVGDWIIGIEADDLRKRRKEKLCPEKDNLVIYVAKVDEILTLNEYFHDERFQMKKFVEDEGWERRRGDNVYYIEDGMWKWIRGHEHDGNECKFFPIQSANKSGCKLIDKDIEGNKVFICKEFSYFGDKCVEFDKQFATCIIEKQGIKYCKEDNPKYKEFLTYIQKLMSKYGKSKIGNPILCSIGERKCIEKETNLSSCAKN